MRGGPAERAGTALLTVALVLAGSAGAAAGDEKAAESGETAAEKAEKEDEPGHSLELETEPRPLPSPDELPPRARPLLEIGPRFLGVGELSKGWKLPTGAVWTPSIWVFGETRVGVGYLEESDREERLEAALRLDLFAALQLSATERLVVGVSPLHREGRFSTYAFRPDEEEGWVGEGNLDLVTIFFEGDLGEIFPRLDERDTKALDYGFAVGRQALVLQDGLFFNDLVDSVGVVKHNLFTFPGASSFRWTGLVGWNELHRGDGREDEDGRLLLLTSETDVGGSTLTVDLAWVGSDREGDDGGDGAYWAFGATQRIGYWNTTFRGMGSYALDEETPGVSHGHLLFVELSTTPRGTHDLLYASAFWGLDRFTSVARDPTTGGPLGRAGLLYASVGLGRWQPALDNRPDDAYGGAFGYQKFWNGERTQLVLEAGARDSTADGRASAALGGRFAQKLANQFQLRADAYVSGESGRGPRWGLRTELLFRF